MPVSCPLCGIKSDLLFKAKDLNRKVSEEYFSYCKCIECGLIFLSDVPDKLADYYEEEYYAVPSKSKLEKVAKAESYQLDMVKKFVKSGRILEIGPGFGIFAYGAKQAGFDVDVIEMDMGCCDYLSKTVGVNVINSNSPHKVIETMLKHDVIASWHVIEHLPNPWDFLASAANNLNSGGILLIATPNPEALGFKVLKASWPHVDAPRHIFLILVDILIKRVKPMGLRPVMLTFNDKGAKSWNRFGWQRYLMNIFSNKWLQRIAFVLGGLVSLFMILFETGKKNGSAYTVIFQKD